jgi:hypothetical protein
MNLKLMRTVAMIDAANVVTVAIASRQHGAAAAAGYAPALIGTLLVHRHKGHRRLARILCVSGLAPNTILSIAAAGGSTRSRVLSAYVAVGGLIVGAGYLGALRADRYRPPSRYLRARA